MFGYLERYKRKTGNVTRKHKICKICEKDTKDLRNTSTVRSLQIPHYPNHNKFG